MQAATSETKPDKNKMAGKGETEKRPENLILIGKTHHQNGNPATTQPPHSHHQAPLPSIPPLPQGHMRNYSYPPPPHSHHHPPPSMYRHPPPPPGYQMPPNPNGYPPYPYQPPFAHHRPHLAPAPAPAPAPASAPKAPAPSNGDGSDEKSSDKKVYVRKTAGNKWTKDEVC